MTKWERRAAEFADRNLPWIAMIVFSLLKLAVAWKVRAFASKDMLNYLLPWFEAIRSGGGLRALSQQVGNGGILYQTLIALMTYLPLEPMSMYKLLSLGFDFLLGAGSFLLVWELEGRGKQAVIRAAVVYCIIILSPIVQMNSVVWGQCDSVYTFFAVMALYLLWKEEYTFSFGMLGIAFAFKLQAVFFLPAFVIWYFKSKKFSVLHFLLIPAAMAVTAIPGLLMGRSVTDVFSVFAAQADAYHWNFGNCGGLGAVLANHTGFYDAVSPLLICTCLLYLFILLVLALKDPRPASLQQLLEVSFLSAFGCFVLLPAMHERYGYPAEILGILIAARNRKTIPLLIPMLCITALTYGKFLFGLQIDCYPLLGMVNVMLLTLYTLVLFPPKRAVPG